MMNLVELAKEFGLFLTKKGNSYSSPCPGCGGNDRFIVWQNNRYWCRQCGKYGDAIQFCRDFLGMTYSEACKKLNLSPKTYFSAIPIRCKEFKIAEEPSLLWQEKALAFVNWSHRNLMSNISQLKILHERMFRNETIIKYRLGFCKNPKLNEISDLYLDRSGWGLAEEFNEHGKPKKLWCPSGLVIPTFEREDKVIKLKIRRSTWHEEDKKPKYVEVAGSMQKPAWLGYKESVPAMIVESEFDAMLVQQEAGDLCSTIALGGVAKRPDMATHNLLKKCPLILYALDFDEAGKNAYIFWRQKYVTLRPWPVPQAKSPGDAIKMGIPLREWVIQGISEYLFSFKGVNLIEK